MKYWLKLISLIGLFGFYSINIECNSQKRLSKRNFHDTLSYERTPCYGTCPQYKLLIPGNGLMTFEGIMFTEKSGIWQKQMDQKELNNIFKTFDAAKLEQYSDKYPSEYSDLPSVIITFKKDQNKKSIQLEGEHPKTLATLSKLLDSLANSPQWIKVGSK